MPCTRSLGLLGMGLSPGKQEEHTLLILIVKGRAIRSLGHPRSCAAIRFREAEAAWTCATGLARGRGRGRILHRLPNAAMSLSPRCSVLMLRA